MKRTTFQLLVERNEGFEPSPAIWMPTLPFKVSRTCCATITPYPLMESFSVRWELSERFNEPQVYIVSTILVGSHLIENTTVNLTKTLLHCLH